MADILSPEEIEALLTSLSGDEAEAVIGVPGDISSVNARRASVADSTAPARARSGNYELYDFRRPDKLSKDQLRTLHMLHDTYARLASTQFASFLRSTVQIELISVEQIPYEEYLRSINQSVFTIITLAPLSGQAVLELEFGLVFSMIDRMLGGPGRSVNRASLTDIERPLVTQLVEKALTALKNAWEAIFLVNPRIEGMETSSQFVQICPPTDIAVMILFEVKVGEQRGAMSICVPYLVLKPVTMKLAAQKWAASAGRKKGSTYRRQLAIQIARSEVPCKIELGTTGFTVREFLNLEIGDVIKLEQKQTDDLLIHVKEKPKFVGRPLKSGKKLAVQVTGLWSE